MDKHTATQAAVNAVAVATQAINDYTHNPDEAAHAYETALSKVTEARTAGATEDDLRTTPPA